MTDRKEAREVQILEGQAATFFGVDWLNRTTTCYVCERCRYVHWFLLD